MPRQRRIDLASAARAIRRGESLASYAARTGFTPGAVREVLRSKGIRVPRKRSTTDPRLYSVWRSIRSRCERKADPAFARYGARGVSVCAAWQAYPAFQEWALRAGWTPGKHLVLRVPTRGCRPSNCRWGTRSEATQSGITAFGETKSASAWARDARARVNAQTIRDRVRDGVEPEAAIAEPWLRHPGQGKARTYARIDWKRVRALRHLRPVAIARRLGRSVTAIRRGMRERGWACLSPQVRGFGWPASTPERLPGSFDGVHGSLEAGQVPTTALAMIDTLLGTDALAALRAYSASANRNIPHPLDEERWNKFVILAHEQQAELGADELEEWLIDQGWHDERASELSLRYEAGRALLKQYDRAR